MKNNTDLYYYSPKTLNIFCDASNITIGEETISCAGAIAVYNGKGFQYELETSLEIIRNSTNNRGELYAIYLALQLANKYKHDYVTINIFSDSKISVLGLREWIFTWIKDLNSDGYMMNTSGVVKNQDLIAMIVTYAVNNKVRFNLYHCKGHVNRSGGPNNALNVFNKSNNTTISNMNMIKLMCQFNDKVDSRTRVLVNQYSTESGMETYVPIIRKLDEEKVLEYSNYCVNSNYAYNL